MNFSDALVMLKEGQQISRYGWNGKDMYIYMHMPIQHAGFEQLRFIMMKTADNCLVPWLASQTDMLAEDWMVVD
jgi:hypothetical protein